MWKKIIIFLTVVAMCSCESDINNRVYKKKPFYHDSYLLYGGGILYYLTFILIKVKVAFVLGTIFTVLLVAGKLFAIVKYAGHLKLFEGKDKHEPEKIYVQAPHHAYDDHDDHDSIPYSAQEVPYYKYSSGPPMSDMNQFPPNAEISGGQYYDSIPSQQYGRSSKDTIADDAYVYYNLFLAMINKFKGTEMAFKMMKLKSAVCKRKFVCRIEYTAKYSTALSSILSVVRDQDYNNYINRTTDSWSDCDRFYPNCKQIQI